MEVRHCDASLDRLETDPEYTGGYDQAIVRAFRLRMQTIRAAPDEREFFAIRSFHFEKLKGNRDHQHSIRLNKQWRLILELDGTGSAKVVCIVAIEDYH
jgi:proteic killer suppression protein